MHGIVESPVHLVFVECDYVLGIHHTNSFIAHNTCQEFNWYAGSLTWTWNFPVKLSQESVSTHHWKDYSEDFPLHKYFSYLSICALYNHTAMHTCVSLHYGQSLLQTWTTCNSPILQIIKNKPTNRKIKTMGKTSWT